MTRLPYSTLLAAGLAVAFIGTAAAQNQSNEPARLPAKKGTAQETQTEPSYQKPQKMEGNAPMTQNEQTNAGMHNEQMGKAEAKTGKTNMQPKEQMKNGNAMAPEASSGQKSQGKQASNESAKHHQAMRSHTGSPHAGKSKRQSEQAMSPDEKAYRDVLRDCAKEQSSSQRDSCLDSAIERFHKNA